MENIRVDLKNNIVTVVLTRNEDNDLEAIREASKILQREVLRRENNSSKRFYR